MPAARTRSLIVLLALAATVTARPAARQEPQPKPQLDAQAPPTFRGGVNFVSVDAIVTDDEDRPVGDLRETDFEVLEDGRPQRIEQFKVVRIDRRPDEEPRPIRDHIDEEREAARDDVRLFAIYLAPSIRAREYERAREALIRFVRTQLYPSDMVAITAAGTLGEIWFSRDREDLVQRLHRLGDPFILQEGTGGASPVAARSPAAPPMRATRALEELATRLAGLRDGRKSIIYVGDSIGSRSGDLTLDFYELVTTLNRTNTTVYVMDLGGLTTRSNLGRTTNLRALAEDTGGIAIVNTNNYDANLVTVARDATSYYLMGYTSAAPSDGKFHEIDVRVHRGGLHVRSRSGFLAYAPAPVVSPFPKPPDTAAAIKTALATIDPAVAASRYVETWVGSEQADSGHARVTLVWDPLPAVAGSEGRRDARFLSVVAFDSANATIFSRPDDQVSLPLDVGGLARAVSFDASPGRIRLRVSIQDRDGGVLDSETRTIDVPDFTAPRSSLGPPRVFRARNAREFRQIAEDPSALPAATRVFSRTDHLLMRVDRVKAGESVHGALLNRLGQVMMEIPAASGPRDGTRQFDLNLNSLPPGDYLVEISAVGDGVGEKALVPFRVRG